MKITPTSTSVINQAYSNQAQASAETQSSKSGQGKAPETVIAGDSVNLSASAKDLNMVRESMNNGSESRSAYVAELKSRVEEGTYTVDADKVADRILGETIDYAV